MKKLMMMSVGLAAVLALSGCVGGSGTTNAKPTHRLTALPAPTPTTASTDPITSEIVDTVLVQVYAGTAFKAKHGCGCRVSKTATEELFPAGTPVMLLKITLTGRWKPSQGQTTTQDVNGITLNGTKFHGRPEDAVLDTKDGPAAAKAAGLPWLPAGLFRGQSDWKIPNNQPQAFAAAWYVPKGVDQLLLTVDVPAEGQPNHLFVPLPHEVIKLTAPSQE